MPKIKCVEVGYNSLPPTNSSCGGGQKSAEQVELDCAEIARYRGICAHPPPCRGRSISILYLSGVARRQSIRPSVMKVRLGRISKRQIADRIGFLRVPAPTGKGGRAEVQAFIQSKIVDCGGSARKSSHVLPGVRQIGTKLRDWAIWLAQAGCYSQAALSSNTL